MTEFLYIGSLPQPVAHFREHQHEHWELCCYLVGHGIATVGGRRIPFRPGTIICMPPRTSHCEDAPKAPMNNLHIAVRGFAVPDGGVPVCADDAAGSFRRVGEALLREFHLRPIGWEATTRNLFAVLLAYLRRWLATADPLVGRVEALLIANLRDPAFRIAGAAAALGISPDTLYRRFAAATGETPRQYLTRLRIEEATRLLQQGLRVSDVAERIGFADPYYFSRFFRSATGKPPSGVRSA